MDKKFIIFQFVIPGVVIVALLVYCFFAWR